METELALRDHGLLELAVVDVAARARTPTVRKRDQRGKCYHHALRRPCGLTFNWAGDITRRAGLGRAFPHAVSANFKVRDLGPAGEHPAYDLRACFDIGYAAGFHGPWCIEHAHSDRGTLFRNLRHTAGLLRRWMAESGKPRND